MMPNGDTGVFDDAIIKEFTKPDFKMGDTSFTIQKKNAFAGFEMLEVIKEEIGKQLAVERAPLRIGADANIGAFVQLVMGLDRHFLARIREDLFRNVYFVNDDMSGGGLPVTGNEDQAFDGMEPLAIYELFVRCLAVNFTASCLELMSRMTFLMPS